MILPLVMLLRRIAYNLNKKIIITHLLIIDIYHNKIEEIQPDLTSTNNENENRIVI